MKYNKFYNKEQEIRNDLFADAFGSILGMDLYTSVVNPLPEMITDIRGSKGLEGELRISKSKNSRKVITVSGYAFHKTFVS
ncbi:hypothetical protein [Aquimarina sp. 2201CG5-10]|uniref:hypothetical protein n=1 Tax=Aquimarina callyspongiae TaxID=3098150 RepID=UPI002AB38CED|nr:hypothetical protein [Aquimarina sp. 2201CG5-10]MDY8134662.1 hypothetical protein [Aquimarina sp. 2201CG5-10]